MLEPILTSHLDQAELTWLTQKLASLRATAKAADFYLAFSGAHRFIAKISINFNQTEINSLGEHFPELTANNWTKLQLARLTLVMALPETSNREILAKLFETADLEELVVLYRSLAFLANARDFTERAAEGVRTNMTDVFDALCLHNPFPARHFSDAQWNQMLLKAVFMQRPLYRIYDLETRINTQLAAMAMDYMQERWAAGRIVTPEIWRLLKKNLSAKHLAAIQDKFDTEEAVGKDAIARAILESASVEAKHWLSNQDHPTPHHNWEDIGKIYEEATHEHY